MDKQKEQHTNNTETLNTRKITKTHQKTKKKPQTTKTRDQQHVKHLPRTRIHIAIIWTRIKHTTITRIRNTIARLMIIITNTYYDEHDHNTEHEHENKQQTQT